MATAAMRANRRTVGIYSTSAGRRDVGMITRSGDGTGHVQTPTKASVSWALPGGMDRIGTTFGSQRPVNRVPHVFAAHETGRALASV